MRDYRRSAYWGSRALATAGLAWAALVLLCGPSAAAQPSRLTRGLTPAFTAGGGKGTPTCIVRSLPTFVAQGEYKTTATVADIIEVECKPEIYGTGSKVEITAAQLFSRCAGKDLWIVPNPFKKVKNQVGVTVQLDADGNATVAVIAGPGCSPGESLISLHMLEEPFESATTAFDVLAPRNTPEGVIALPPQQVEDSTSGGIATIVEAEFPGGSEKKLRIASPELFSRCRVAPHLRWFNEKGEETQGPEVTGIQLDNNGNAFLVAIGDSSCAEGSSLIEADLESKPFTTLSTEFEVLPPQQTEEPAFTIEKLQEIAGSAKGFTTAPLKGALHQTVNYEIRVTNTSSVTETLTGFTDVKCEPGSPGSRTLGPGESTVYTCHHELTEVGTYTNEASVTGQTVGGRALTETSNQVVVEVVAKPAFTIVKEQEIAGSGTGPTKVPLVGKVGQTVDYTITVQNTGEAPLTFGALVDEHCEGITGGPTGPLAPGKSATYTCTHVLATTGPWLNAAIATTTGPEGIKHESNTVEVSATKSEPGMTVTKLQEIVGSGKGFTAAKLTANVGQTVIYEIVIENTGNEPLTLGKLNDPKCDPGSEKGPGTNPLPPKASTTYTCTRELKAAEEVTNIATVSAKTPGGTPLEMSSPKVEVVASKATKQEPKGGVGPEKVACIARAVLHGVNGPQRGTFSVWMSARGLAQVTFYLDGRKLATLKHAQARHGVFKVLVHAGRLAHGAHRVSFKAVPSGAQCPRATGAKVFVRPARAARPPKFTG